MSKIILRKDGENIDLGRIRCGDIRHDGMVSILEIYTNKEITPYWGERYILLMDGVLYRCQITRCKFITIDGEYRSLLRLSDGAPLHAPERNDT